MRWHLNAPVRQEFATAFGAVFGHFVVKQAKKTAESCLFVCIQLNREPKNYYHHKLDRKSLDL